VSSRMRLIFAAAAAAAAAAAVHLRPRLYCGRVCARVWALQVSSRMRLIFAAAAAAAGAAAQRQLAAAAARQYSA
jgi:hypothetical protein